MRTSSKPIESRPSDPWALYLTRTQRAALDACARHGRLNRYCYHYGPEPLGMLYEIRTIESLVARGLMRHGMSRLRHFHVTLTPTGRLFAGIVG